IMAGAYIVEINWQKHSIFEPVKTMFSSRHTRYILLSCLLYAISSICDKWALNYVTPITYLLIIQFFIAINFTILINLFYGGFKDISSGFRHAGKSIFLIAFLTITYRLLQAWAVSLTLVSLVVPIKRLSTLFSTLAGGRLFHEKGTKRKAIACIIMLVGAYLIIA
ncbi:MAG: DMT family transporter, partial [Candidatus Aenigmarchaeota archaeon]|nr:DMT family transporter [Candidatus Aenigmarchaeota archaeon]